MLHQAIFTLGLIATVVTAQNLAQNLEQNVVQSSVPNSLVNESQKFYPPDDQQQQQQPTTTSTTTNNTNSAQQFALQALMQISSGTEKFSLELYKVNGSSALYFPKSKTLKL